MNSATKTTKICKICGAEYTACYSARKIGEGFRWQDCCCCPEHGSEYLARIEASRSGANKPVEVKVASKKKKAIPNPEQNLSETDLSEILKNAKG